MAARAPSAIDLTLNEENLRPRKRILSATPDLVLDNQERLVDMPRVLLCDLHAVSVATSAVAFTRMAGLYYFRGRDTMGTGTITTARVYLLSRSRTANTVTFRARFGGATNYDLVVTGGDTTWSWRLISSAVTLNSDETEENVEVYGTVSTGGEEAMTAGILITTV